ncbi:SCO6745 family protein [Streptomyces sp. enrichment culture]|uniref:SCO6745 family protein n=1 Tax=Streptomyces sp. enrichment culture TaxID=1795815 RepID=UPI003F570338
MHLTSTNGRTSMDMNAVREISLTINAAHLFVYFIPEAPEEAARLGVTEVGPAYFAFRSAPMGPVPWQVALAAFYNFSPRSVQAMTGVWDAATPQQWQAARFAAVERALQRVDVKLPADQIAEARSLIDPVVARADYAGKTMAAANASLPLPSDPLVALWQRITVLREWRGDAHFTVLAAHGIGPCDCNVLQTATGHFPEAIARATRLWNDEEVAAATTRLAARGWITANGTATNAGITAREQIETETDEHCAALWTLLGDANVRRLTSLVLPIHDAFTAAGTYPFHVDTGAMR